MSIFPMIEPKIADSEGARGLYIEAAWDFERSAPIYRGGKPVMITGAPAVLVWAWHALKTPRFMYEIFTRDYGNELRSLVGKPYSDELKLHEAPRLIKEALLVNPYITDVEDVSVSLEGSWLEIDCRIMTVYGEVRLHV